MQCRNCGSRLMSWEIDSGRVLISYNEKGEQTSLHTEIDSINSPMCEVCGSTSFIIEFEGDKT